MIQKRIDTRTQEEELKFKTICWLKETEDVKLFTNIHMDKAKRKCDISFSYNGPWFLPAYLSTRLPLLVV